MRLHLKRHKTLRNAGLATMVAATALLLSGCRWATVVDYGGGTKTIAATQYITNNVIWDCTATKGTGSGRAFCVTDTLSSLCLGIPTPGVSSTECYEMKSVAWQDTDQAIRNVLGPDDCLVYFEYPDHHNFWGSAPLGQHKCIAA